MTKSFVATLVLQLVGEGRLSLDDNLERWLPGLVPKGEQITVRELLNHTSGLYNYTDDLPEPPRRFRPQQLVAIATDHKPLFAPGTEFSYSNTNYILAGLHVERVTGQRLADQLEQRIFQPLGLDDTERVLRHGRLPWVAGPWRGGLVGHQLGLHDQSQRLADRLDHVLDGGHRPLGERHQPPGSNPDPATGWRFPVGVAGQRSGAQVQHPPVLQQAAIADIERFVVDQQPDQFTVGDVDDRLAGLGVAVGRLGLRHRPPLVEGVEVGPGDGHLGMPASRNWPRPGGGSRDPCRDGLQPAGTARDQVAGSQDGCWPRRQPVTRPRCWPGDVSSQETDVERADWLDEGFDAAQAQFVMVTAITPSPRQLTSVAVTS